MAQVLIVGGGRIGSYLATLLPETGHQVSLIERDQPTIERLRRTVPSDLIVHGNGTDAEVLERAGIHRSDTVVAVTDRDETNLMVASIAKFEFGVARTIGRVCNPRNVWLYDSEMGVDIALNQADIIAHIVAEELSLGDLTTLLKLRRGQFEIVEIRLRPDSSIVGRRMNDIDLPDDAILIGVLREGSLTSPLATVTLGAGDEILAVVQTGRRLELARTLGAHAPA